jgi:glutamate carboxypeptidase
VNAIPQAGPAQVRNPAVSVLADRSAEWLARLARWVDASSFSGDAGGLGAMADLLDASFSELGSPVERIDVGGLGPALRMSRREHARVQVLLCGHYDTVFPPMHPFRGLQDAGGGRLVGPGVADMKGGLLILLETLREFEKLPVSRELGWEVILTPDEEVGSPHGGPLLRAAAKRHQAALSFEASPVDGRIARARPAVGRYLLEMTGRSAHAGRDPISGRNALVRLASAIATVHAWSDPAGGVFCNPARFQSEPPLNVVPDRATAEVGVRAFGAEAAAALRGRFEKLAADVSAAGGYVLTCCGGFTRPAKEIHPGDEALFSRLQTAGAAIGIAISWADTGGASDGNLLSAEGVSVIDNLGVRGGGLHGEGEFALVESLPERVALCVELLGSLARSAGNGERVP